MKNNCVDMELRKENRNDILTILAGTAMAVGIAITAYLNGVVIGKAIGRLIKSNTK